MTILRRNTILSYSEEMFCLTMLESSDDKLLYNFKSYEAFSPENVFQIFTTQDNLSMLVENNFAHTALLSEIEFRGLSLC